MRLAPQIDGLFFLYPAATPTDSGATMRIRKATTAESEHRELYRLLGVEEKIMSPKTIWSETGDHE